MIEGAIFDMDGVLLDSMSAWKHTGELYLKTLGIRAEPGLDETLSPLSMEAGAAYLLERYSLKGVDVPDITKGITEIIEGFYAEEAQVKPGVKGFLAELHKRAVPMTVATSSARTLAEAAFRRNGILQYFSRIFTCSEVGAGKVEPDIYLEAAGWMGTTPDKTWVFEDALHALETAGKAGFRLAGVYDDSGKEVQEKIRERCHIYLGEIMDFTYFYNIAVK